MAEDSLYRFAAVIFMSLAVALVGTCVFAVWYNQDSNVYERKIKEEAEAVPRLISQTDGCRVYAFKRAGHEHYFTRCGDTVTTERNYSEYCGKACTKHKTEAITTKGNSDD